MKETIDDYELGRRLWAALVSYQLGYSGVDVLLKKSRGHPIDPKWEEIARRLLRDAVEKLGEGIE